MASVVPAPPTTVVRERLLAAPPHRVYRAWLDPAALQRWLAPGDLALARAEVDERVGGRFRIWQTEHDSAQPVAGFEAEILELVPDRRIVLRWGFVGPDHTARPRYDSRLTVELAPAPDGGTHLTLLHEQLQQLADALPDVARQIGGGWDAVLDQLTVAVKGAVQS